MNKEIYFLKEVDLLNVLYHGRKVGRLTLAPNGRCAFEYDSGWLKEGFSISPIKLPLKKGLFIAKSTPFEGNFGVFSDSLPDGWGRLLLNRVLEQHGIDELTLNPIQRLSMVGGSGMGALCYLPEQALAEAPEIKDLHKIEEETEKILSEKPSEALETLFRSGGNSGGARPKYLIGLEGRSWLVKFRNHSDPENIGETEYRYSLAAKACGIRMPETRLFEGRYFGTERFDLRNGERIHMITAAGLLDADFREVSLDYIALMQATGYLTQSANEVEQMFRLMVFNVLTGNRDDHAKNFSFLYCDGKWCLAPAYDLSPSAGFNGQHTTTINGRGTPVFADLVAAGAEVSIKGERATQLFSEVYENCWQLLIPEWAEYDAP